MEQKLKHLEFCQSVINRMSESASLLRGWAVTVVAGLFALAAKDSNTDYLFIGLLAVSVFWVLDGYFLYQERLFRALFDEVRKKVETAIDFSMDVRPFRGKERTWVRSIFSVVPSTLYGALILGMVGLCLFVRR